LLVFTFEGTVTFFQITCHLVKIEFGIDVEPYPSGEGNAMSPVSINRGEQEKNWEMKSSVISYCIALREVSDA